MNKHFARRLALAVAACFSWSLALAASARAITARPPAPPSRTWTLSANEMQRIIGATAIRPDPTGGNDGTGTGSSSNAGATPGPTVPWAGSVGDVSTGTGNKLTVVPVVGWTARGGLKVQFSLFHASQSSYTTGLNPKWTCSYQNSSVAEWTSGGNVTPYWDDQSAYTFSRNVDGSYSRPAGIHDTLIKNGSSGYDVVTKDQIRYHFGFFYTQNNTSYWLLSSISDENGNTITINRNASGSVQTIVDPTGRTITLGRDSNGHLQSITDPLNRQWKITYDTSGRFANVYLPPLPNSAPNYGFGYDANNNINYFGLLDGTHSSATYNGDSTVSSETDPCNNVTRFAYTSTQTTITAPNLVQTVHTYANGRLASITDGLNNTEYYSYDTDNNKTQVQDKRGYYWKYSYDGMGNCLTAQDPYSHQTTMTYTSHNHLQTARLPRGRNVLLSYDGADNLTQVDQKEAGGTTLATTRFTIGSFGLVSDKYDANNHHYHYDYDANGNLADQKRPSGLGTYWVYDGLGVCKSREDGLGHTDYALDAWERTTAASYVNNSQYNSTFSYDERGDLTHFSNYAGSYDRYYDNDGRMLSEYRSGVIQVSHNYDGTNEQGLLSQTTDITNRAIHYGYTGRNQLAWVNDGSGGASYGYDANGNVSGSSNGNGTTVSRGYDNVGNLTSLNNYYSNGSAIGTFSYGYNEDSQRISASENNGGGSYVWSYNSLGQMTSEVRTGAAAYTNTYGYDNVSNRTSDTINGRVDTLINDADDELKTFTNNGTPFSYTYDSNGNQTSRVWGVPYTLTYDPDNNLMHVSSASGTVYYTYDAIGRRASRQVGGSVGTEYQYDGSQMLTETTNGSTSQYLWGPGGLVRRDGEWPTADGLGNTRVVTSGSQSATSNQLPDAYGQTVSSGGSTSVPYQWGQGSGYRSDLDAGLIQVGARYYDRDSGRFISRDTDLDESPYAYCGGDPINFTDPSGHNKKPDPPKPIIIPLGNGTAISYDPTTGAFKIISAITFGNNPSATVTTTSSSNGTGSVSGSVSGSSGNTTYTGNASYSSPGGFSGNGIVGYKTGGFGATDAFGTGKRNEVTLMFGITRYF